jgi:hypothetical protein
MRLKVFAGFPIREMGWSRDSQQVLCPDEVIRIRALFWGLMTN